MANITRFDPFGKLTRYDPFEDMDDLFRGVFLRPMRLDWELQPRMNIKMDVTKAEDGYTVKAEMPGVKKEDIQVSIDGNEVTITGEVKKEAEEKKGEAAARAPLPTRTAGRAAGAALPGS